MHGLMTALFAVDFPGHDAGRGDAPFRSSKTTAKTSVKTTGKTV